MCTCICSEIAHVDVTFFFSSPSVSFLFWCICVCIVLFQATSFNERNAFLVAFQVLRHLLHCNFSVITWKINFDWLIDWWSVCWLIVTFGRATDVFQFLEGVQYIIVMIYLCAIVLFCVLTFFFTMSFNCTFSIVCCIICIFEYFMFPAEWWRINFIQISFHHHHLDAWLLLLLL